MPTRQTHRHHVELIRDYLHDFCEVVGKTQVEDDVMRPSLPNFEIAVSTKDFNPPDPLQLPVLCYCREIHDPTGNGCIMHPGFGFRFRKIDENIYSSRTDFDQKFPWTSKQKKLVGRFSAYERAGRYRENRTRKAFVDFAATQGDTMDVRLNGKIPIREFMKEKYILHLDGVAHSFQLEEKLGMNSVVVSEKKKFQTYFTHLLEPGKHYVDFWDIDDQPEDIVKVLDWLKANDDLAYNISKNGQDFAHRYLTKRSRLAYYRELLSRYAALLQYEVEKPVSALRVCCPGDHQCNEHDLDVQIMGRDSISHH